MSHFEDPEFVRYAVLYGVVAAEKHWEGKVRCSECGRLVPETKVEWADYYLMNTDELMASMPVCAACVQA